MAKIEQPKTYVGQDLENIFFRPMLTGPNANELGINIMYNMPVPTTLHMWRRLGDVLQKYTTGGWSGGNATERFQKTLDLKRVKAEVGYGADEYYNRVYGAITNLSANMGDLTGTELEKAETELFSQCVAESIRATMWVGNTSRTGKYDTFDGILTRIMADIATNEADIVSNSVEAVTLEIEVEDMFKNQLKNANPALRDLRAQGNLAFFVSSNVYEAYENFIDESDNEAAWLARQNGRAGLYFRGIPVIDVQVSKYLADCDMGYEGFSLLTDRRNLTLAVNTADFPGTEVKMWYNPDAMENRQRAVFMAGADYLMPELISFIKVV